MRKQQMGSVSEHFAIDFDHADRHQSGRTTRYRELPVMVPWILLDMQDPFDFPWFSGYFGDQIGMACVETAPPGQKHPNNSYSRSKIMAARPWKLPDGQQSRFVRSHAISQLQYPTCHSTARLCRGYYLRISPFLTKVLLV